MSVIGRFQSRTAHQVLCLLLCVLTWRGPVPVLHNHASLSDAGHRHQHALACHKTDNLRSGELSETDWHWHFALWTDIGGTRGCDADPLAAEAEGFAWISGVRIAGLQTRDLNHVVLSSGHAHWSSAALLPQQHSASSDLRRGIPGSFLASLRADRPLVTITGVSLI